jgi:hypothetical protein
MDAGAVYVVPFAGALSVMLGGALAGDVGALIATLVNVAVDVRLALWLVTARPT